MNRRVLYVAENVGGYGVFRNSECLDVEAQEKDSPLRRVAFVAAFAMANYSSTIGRIITKPFNPMLVSFVFL